ncbi:MAG: hypothetical protein QXD62_00300 [Candidatus Woesearchaeota archaeon]
MKIVRKIIHILFGCFFSILFYLNLLSSIHVFYLLILSSIISFIHKHKPLPILRELLNVLQKPNENKFPGKGFIMFLIGILLATRLFPKDIALASIMILTFGDSLSEIFSAICPYPKFSLKKGKSLFGFLISFFASLLTASFFVSPFLAFFGVISAIILELFEIKIEDQILDDNIMIPLVSGTIMFFIRYNL